MFKMEHRIPCLLSIPLLLVFIFSSVFTSSAGVPELEVHQLHLNNLLTYVPYSNIGLLTLNYVPDETASFVNIVAKNKDNSGYFWIVRNLYLPPASFISTPQSISVRFQWSDLDYTEGEAVTSIEVAQAKSAGIAAEVPVVTDFTTVAVDTLTEDAAGDETEIPAEMPALETVSFYPGFAEGDEMAELEYRGCSVPNIDLDDATYGDDGTWAGDRNACGPASAANSMKWLAEKYAEITLDLDTRTIMQQLSESMGRADNQGVNIEQFIRGKLDFIAEHDLPINVKFQSQTLVDDVSGSAEMTARNDNGGASYPTWEWLKAEIAAGEDVEVMYFWWDGEKWRGHAVVVTGIEETANGLKTIKFKHDVRQSSAGGTRQESEGIVIDGQGRMVLRSRNAFIAHAVAESPGTPFPVEMSAFDAKIEGNTVLFSWQTVSETNNYGFEILKNAEKIGFVPGNGTTAQPQSYAFTDDQVGNGRFFYELIQIDFDGTRNVVGTREVVLDAKPGDFVLAQNYPNPFNPTTTISFSIPRKGFVKLSIFNILGNEIRTLVKKEMAAGTHQIQFDGSDLVSGVYYYKLEAAGFSEMKKFILLK